MKLNKEVFFISLMLSLLLNGAIKTASSQDFTVFEKSQIADSVDKLLIDTFVKTLDLNDGSDNGNDRPNTIGMQKFRQAFNYPQDSTTPIIPNFVFDPDSVSDKLLSPEQYIALFTKYYDYGIFDDGISYISPNSITQVGDNNFISPSGIKQNRFGNFSRYIDNVKFEKSGKRFQVTIPFEISTFSGIYKKIRFTDENGNEDFKIRRPFSNSRIILIATISFDKADGKYRIIGMKPAQADEEGCFKYFTPATKESMLGLINATVKQAIELMNTANEYNKPRTIEAKKLEGLFSSKAINTINCSVFFPEGFCDTLLSPHAYTRKVDSIYDEFYPLKEKGEREIECMELGENYIFVSVTSTIDKPRAKDKNGVWFKPDELLLTMNLLIPFDDKINTLQKNDLSITAAYLTHVGKTSQPLQLIPERRYGSFSYSLNYHLDYQILPLENNEDLNDFSFTPKLSHNVGISVSYFKYDPNSNINWGIGLGLTYRRIQSTAETNTYADTVFNYNHHILGEMDLYKKGADFKQKMTFNSISIPLTGHLKYTISSKSFFDFEAGFVTTVNLNSKIQQSSGAASYQGRTDLIVNDTIFGSYLIQDVPEYGFFSNQEIEIQNDKDQFDLENISFSGILGVTFSKSISQTKPIFIDIGPYFIYSFSNSFKNNANEKFILDEAGYAGNSFAAGLNGKIHYIGLKVGIRWFESVPEYKKTVKF